MDPLARIRGFPAAQPPNDDASSIRGNVTLEQKELSARIFSYHIANHPGSKVFSNQILNGLKLVEVNVRRKKLGGDDKSQGVLEGETICEVEVVEGESLPKSLPYRTSPGAGMLNVYGTLAGGCAFHILD